MVSKVFGKGLLAGAGALALCAIVSETAFAGGFAVREQSAELQGMSFAGAAAGSMGLSSMFFNPATVTQHGGMNSESNISLIIGNSRIKDATATTGGGFPIPGGSDSGNISDGNLGQIAAVPASYMSYQWNDNLFFGLSINAPFGLETKAEKAYVGAVHGVHSKILNIIANPVVGYKINDMISVAAGPQISYIDGKLTSSSSPFALNDDVRLRGDDWGFGFTVGLHVDLGQGTKLGVGYRSQVKHKLEGDFRAFGTTVDASAKVDLPHTVTVSASHQVTDALKLNASFEWADWSSLRALSISTPIPNFPPDTPFNWKDSYFYAIGAEYAFNDALTVRAGFAYEDSPVPDATRGVRVPDNDRYWVSGGMSYRLMDWVMVHGSYTHIFVENASVNLPESTIPSLAGTFKTHIDIVSLSATINW